MQLCLVAGQADLDAGENRKAVGVAGEVLAVG